MPAGAGTKRAHDFLVRLEEVRRVLGYLCCVPLGSRYEGLTHIYEQMNYFLILPKMHVFSEYISFQTGPKEDIFGYQYSVNQIELGFIGTEGRVYPPSWRIRSPLNLDHLQDQSLPGQIPLHLQSLFDIKKLPSEQEDRILSALEWYNRSCRGDATPDISLVGHVA